MAEAKMTSKGQVTIPAEVRKKLKLKPGDQVNFYVMPDGTTIVRAKNKSIEELKGILGNPGIHVPIEDLGFS